MAYKLIVTKDAHADIDETVLYISQQLGNTPAALAFLDDIEKSYANIVENPRMYALCNDERLRAKRYRKIPIKNYLIFYRVEENPKTVIIVRVIYAARDYSKLL
jgi:addiction module RelE/StbE family toxin